MEDYIKQWVTDIYDALHFKAIFYEGGNPNLYAPNGETKATLTSAAKMGKLELSTLFTKATTGESRAFEPLRPVKIEGKSYLVYLCHPDVVQDIRIDMESTWQDAMPRSSDNPLFKVADIVWNNVIVIGDRRCPIELGGNSGTEPIATGALLGQQAIQQILGQAAELVKGSKDWGNQKGYAAEYILGCKAPEFNSSRYGSILVNCARTSVSGDDNLAEINYSAIDTSNQ